MREHVDHEICWCEPIVWPERPGPLRLEHRIWLDGPCEEAQTAAELTDLLVRHPELIQFVAGG